MVEQTASSKSAKDDLINQILAELDQAKAIDVKLFDVSNVNYCFDYVLIASASSKTHARGLADKIEKRFSKLGTKTEGRLTYEWVLIDFGTAVLHVFLDELRPSYDLESLYTSWQKTN